MPNEWRRDDGACVVSDDPERLDIKMIQACLTRSYWAPGISREAVERSVQYSLPFGIYVPLPDGAERQVGFARVITDRTTFAYIADVIVAEDARGRGYSKFLMSCILSHPELRELRQWVLMTGDAHGLYRQFGFEVTKTPEKIMQMRPARFDAPVENIVSENTENV